MLLCRFLPLLKSSCLSNCLNCDSNAEPNFFLAKHALKLLSSAVLLRPVASGLCSFTGKPHHTGRPFYKRLRSHLASAIFASSDTIGKDSSRHPRCLALFRTFSKHS